MVCSPYFVVPTSMHVITAFYTFVGEIAIEHPTSLRTAVHYLNHSRTCNVFFWLNVPCNLFELSISTDIFLQAFLVFCYKDRCMQYGVQMFTA